MKKGEKSGGVERERAREERGDVGGEEEKGQGKAKRQRK